MDYQTGTLLLLYIAIALLAGVALRFALKKSHIPYTVVLLCLGIFIGALFELQMVSASEQTQLALALIYNLDPHLILFIFLPVLIFESAYALEVHLFTRALSQVSLLAIAGLLLSMLMTAVFMHGVFDWDWTTAMLFGALISATDPVAVVALLKEMNSRKRLQTILEGESLLNDGTAIVLFTLFYALLEQHSSNSFHLINTVIEFLRVVILGIATGVVLGWISISWIKRVFNDALIEITLTIIISYLTFYIAEELLHSSGIVAVVTIALIYAGPGRSRISPEVSTFLHQFWEIMAYVANTIIFLLAGFIIAPALFQASSLEWIWLFVIFASLIIIRALSISMLAPILKRMGLGITKQKITVLIWGGLRGTVALAMALVITRSEIIDESIAQDILFYTAGVVFLSMIINATSMSTLMKYLGLDKLPPEKQLTIDKAEHEINKRIDKKTASLKQEHWLKHADWKYLTSQTRTQHSSATTWQAVSQQASELAFRRRMLEMERKTYWSALQKGVIEPNIASILSEIVETVLDGYPLLGPRKELIQYLNPKSRILLRVLALIPHIHKLLPQQLYENTIHIYELARAFTYAQHLLLNYVNMLAPNKKLAYEVKDEIKSNIESVMPITKNMEKHFASTLEKSDTFTAQNILLYNRRDIIHEMVATGLLDVPEAERLIKDTEQEIVNHQKQFDKSNQ